MANYADGFVLPVPKGNVDAYRRMARKAGKVWREHGALEYRECVGDDMPVARSPPFRERKAKPEETVVFAWIVYKSRAHRDRVNAKVMKDPRLTERWRSRCSTPSGWPTAGSRCRRRLRPESSDQTDPVARPDRARRSRDRVDTRTWIAGTGDVEPVVPGEGPEDLRVLRKVVLREARHARNGGRAGPRRAWTASPIGRVRPIHSFSTKPRADVSTTTFMRKRRPSKRLCGSELAQPVQGRGGQHAERKEVEERAFRDDGGKPARIEERRTELRFDDLVAVPLGIVVLLVRVVLVDRVAVLRRARQLHVAAEEARQDGVDIRGIAHHRGCRRRVRSAPVGDSSPARGGSTNVARHPSMSGRGLWVLRAGHLARFPVDDRVGAIAGDPGLTQLGRVELLTQHRLDGETATVPGSCQQVRSDSHGGPGQPIRAAAGGSGRHRARASPPPTGGPPARGRRRPPADRDRRARPLARGVAGATAARRTLARS